MPSRFFCLALLATITGASHAGTPCRTEQARHDRVDVRCTWPAGAQRVRFEAQLAGSHDDTTATLIASVNDAPLSCTAGSKTRIEGEDDGDVTMSCQLTAPPSGSAELRFQLRWYHARYTGFDLRVEPRP